MDMKGKLALVTGSTSGIGLSIAKALAKVGCNIIIHGLGDEKTISDIVNSIKSDYGVSAEYLPGNLLHVKEIKSMVAQLLQRYPTGVDILINNAGISGTRVYLEDVPDECWDAVLAVNLTATFQLTKRLLPFMKDKGWGRIVNMSSVDGCVGAAKMGPYCATKHAILGLTKVVALEMAGNGITCNAVCPSGTDTPMFGQIVEEAAKGLGTTRKELQKIVTKRNGKLNLPEQVAEVVLFLVASAASEQMNGADYKIDYGHTA